MDHKTVIDEQIKVLQNLQSDNVNANIQIELKVNNAINIVNQICNLINCVIRSK
ncbi:hypothetical protein OXPF_39700 [Oxobacter pfennigii]|uniref:Uncharacterized protein n=1 Tax=Oxobacter pfennigii TaxID=36849 RepID=A0A0P8Y6Y3_9CLOT|nr:hypothetical protein [Oxobacter pfennigii]KPU42191.1 hypothetical protein OXPF_39700 [Oxobacter pfennigii]